MSTNRERTDERIDISDLLEADAPEGELFGEPPAIDPLEDDLTDDAPRRLGFSLKLGPLERLRARRQGESNGHVPDAVDDDAFARLVTPLAARERAELQALCEGDAVIYTRTRRARMTTGFIHQMGLITAIAITASLWRQWADLIRALPDQDVPTGLSDVAGELAGPAVVGAGVLAIALWFVVLTDATTSALRALFARSVIDIVIAPALGTLCVAGLYLLTRHEALAACAVMLVAIACAGVTRLLGRAASRGRRRGAARA